MILPLQLSKRYIGDNDGYDNDCNLYGNCYSAWGNWGRWVVLAVIVIVVLFIFFVFSFVSARRRRRRGAQPFRGTGWIPGTGAHGNVNYYGPGGSNAGYYGGAPQYANDPNHQAWQPPPYDASTAGYYGQQQHGVELQQPGNTYQPQRGGDSVYAPPMGPPPGQK